jgi:hypothetical protein
MMIDCRPVATMLRNLILCVKIITDFLESAMHLTSSGDKDGMCASADLLSADIVQIFPFKKGKNKC